MNKLAIPVILAATVLVAGIFAFMPVQQASTVHESLQDTIGTWQEDSLAFTTATVSGGLAADFAITIDADGPFNLLGLFIYWDEATLDDANDDSETLAYTSCLINDDQDNDVVYDFTDVILDSDAADIIEQNVLESIDVPTSAAEGIVIGASDSFDCTLVLDTDGNGVDGFEFTVIAFGQGPGDMTITSTDTTP